MAFPFIIPGVKYSDSLTVLGISIVTAAVCEAISWLLIYRTASYKSLRSAIDKSSKKLDSMKTLDRSKKSSSSSSKAKKLDRVENSLKDASRDLSLFKFKSGAVVAVVLFMVFGFLNSLFDGKPVAKLPFVPIMLVQKMSHRGLPGDDMTDCSMAFLYLLCSVSIRTNLQKFLGFAPPRSAAGVGLFPMPDQKTRTSSSDTDNNCDHSHPSLIFCLVSSSLQLRFFDISDYQSGLVTVEVLTWSCLPVFNPADQFCSITFIFLKLVWESSVAVYSNDIC
ncbi:hypothetical protein V2J09_013774 [Rumex salicifolius]